MSSESGGNLKNRYVKCIVPFCNSPSNIKYFDLPKNQLRKQQWLDIIKPVVKLNQRNKICEQHFSDSSYEKDYKSELLGLKPNKKLKVDAVPSLNLFKFTHNYQLNNSLNNPLIYPHNQST